MPRTRDGAPPCRGPLIAPMAPENAAATSAPVEVMTRAAEVEAVMPGPAADADVAGVHRQVVGLGRRQAGGVRAVDEETPDVLERHPADELLDVDPAVAQRGALLVGLGDLCLERDDALEPVVYLGHCC